MSKEVQSSRYLVICHLLFVMELSIIEATRVFSDLEESNVILFDPGTLNIKLLKENQNRHIRRWLPKETKKVTLK